MARPRRDTSALLDAMAEHVLAHGLNAASLRPLAKAAGTSDRMLIYHFGSKDGLVAALLEHLAARMATGLTAALPPRRAETLGACIGEIVALMRAPALRPYSAVWLDIVSAAAQGGAAHAAAGSRIVEGLVAWIASRLPEGEDDPEGAARLALTLIEGTLVMDAVGRSEVADAAIAALARAPR